MRLDRGQDGAGLRDRRICATGAAISTRSAPSTAAAGEVAKLSMMPSSAARSSERRLRPTPTICAAAPAFFNASANEPPISPTPKMAIF
jgi:hypothetical protein